MSQESDTDGLKDSEVLPPQLEEAVSSTIVQKIASAYKPDAIVVSYSVKPGTKPGDNYMSVMYAVEILLKNGSNNPENIDVMLKTMPKNPLRIREINEMAAFVKEANMYTQLFPGMVKFQEGKGLERSQIFSGWPTCFATFQNGIDDYLAMEDLRGKGLVLKYKIILKLLDRVAINSHNCNQLNSVCNSVCTIMLQFFAKYSDAFNPAS